jgi:hypothetical protein
LVRKLIWIAAGIGIMAMLAIVFFGIPQPDATDALKSTTPSEQAISLVKKAIHAEPTVKDLLYQPGQAVEWQIGVLDNGSSRVGYANYICEVLAQHGALKPATHVRIVDIVRVSRGESFRDASLGHVSCADRQVHTP